MVVFPVHESDKPALRLILDALENNHPITDDLPLSRFALGWIDATATILGSMLHAESVPAERVARHLVRDGHVAIAHDLPGDTEGD